jgi:hypothetical protein
MTTKSDACDRGVMSAAIVKTMTPKEIDHLENIQTPTWKLMKEMSAKIDELERYCQFLQVEVQKQYNQQCEFGKVLMLNSRMRHSRRGA